MERTIAGRYVLRGPLGTGGMADVFVADDLRLHRQVAVKLVPAAAITPTVRARFVREARARPPASSTPTPSSSTTPGSRRASCTS